MCVFFHRREHGEQYEYESVITPNPQQEAMDELSEMYSLLKEEDMWAGLWHKKAK